MPKELFQLGTASLRNSFIIKIIYRCFARFTKECQITYSLLINCQILHYHCLFTFATNKEYRTYYSDQCRKYPVEDHLLERYITSGNIKSIIYTLRTKCISRELTVRKTAKVPK